MQCEYPDYKATTSYQYGCRCERCREGNAARIRLYRHQHPARTKELAAAQKQRRRERAA